MQFLPCLHTCIRGENSSMHVPTAKTSNKDDAQVQQKHISQDTPIVYPSNNFIIYQKPRTHLHL
uniref:Uncharacterized protein n=1 Tax=Nelumbo nucifera TaxID=4432 RepID=A0A822Z0S3_NELNU|nr:TPA_asm: hypothetical protein HUJ06_014317 [Nelumbo nucifera]